MSCGKLIEQVKPSGPKYISILLHLVQSWNEFGAILRRFDGAKSSVLGKDEIQEVPGCVQDDTKLLHKKTVYLTQIFKRTSKGLSLVDIVEAMEHKNRTSFRRNYLDVLKNVEFVTKAIPEYQTSPDQKYVITEKGKLLLSGYNVDIR